MDELGGSDCIKELTVRFLEKLKVSFADPTLFPKNLSYKILTSDLVTILTELFKENNISNHIDEENLNKLKNLNSSQDFGYIEFFSFKYIFYKVLMELDIDMYVMMKTI